MTKITQNLLQTLQTYMPPEDREKYLRTCTSGHFMPAEDTEKMGMCAECFREWSE